MRQLTSYLLMFVLVVTCLPFVSRGQVRRAPVFGQTLAQAEKVITGQNPSWWVTSHNAGCTANLAISSIDAYWGTKTLTGVSGSYPVCRTTDIKGEGNYTDFDGASRPAGYRTSPNGTPSFHFYDGGNNRKLTTTASVASTNQTIEFIVQMDWIPGGGGTLFSISNSAGKNIYMFSIPNWPSSNQRFPMMIGNNGAGVSAALTPDARMIGVVTLKWTNANAVKIKWNNADQQTIDLSGAFSSGALTDWMIGASVYGGGHQTKWWSIAHWTRETSDAEDTARFKAYQTIYGLFTTAYVKTETNPNQGNFILRPLGTANGKVFIYNHGAGQDAQQMCLQTYPYAEIPKAFVRDGWTVACSTASYNNWGSANGVTDLNSLYSYVKTTYSTNGKLAMGGHSMGGLLSLNAARLGDTTLKGDLKAVTHAGNGVADLANSYNQSSSWRTDICSQYGITSCTSTWSASTDYLTKTSGYDAVLQAASGWANYHFLFHTTSADSLIVRATHPAVMITKLTGNVQSLQELTGNCDHGDSAPCGSPPVYMYVPGQWVSWANLVTR